MLAYGVPLWSSFPSFYRVSFSIPELCGDACISNLFLLGIVFDTQHSESSPLLSSPLHYAGIVFDTHEGKGELFCCMEECPLFLPGIVFETHHPEPASLLSVTQVSFSIPMLERIIPLWWGYLSFCQISFSIPMLTCSTPLLN